MNHIITIAVSVVAAMLTFALQTVIKENRNLKKAKDEEQNQKELERETKEKAIEKGVQSLLRVKLIEYHDKYINRDSISTNGYENWGLMYEAYKDLGGNGMITHMHEEIEELHIRTNK